LLTLHVAIYPAIGAGYVLNNEALQILLCAYDHAKQCVIHNENDRVVRIIKRTASRLSDPGAADACLKTHPGSDCRCSPDKLGNHEDFMTGICLGIWNVNPHDTRDALGRDRFNSYTSMPVCYQEAPPHSQWYYDLSFAVSDQQDWRRRVVEYPIGFHSYNPVRDFAAVPIYGDVVLPPAASCPPSSAMMSLVAAREKLREAQFAKKTSAQRKRHELFAKWTGTGDSRCWILPALPPQENSPHTHL
jgi:hypothetical protein